MGTPDFALWTASFPQDIRSGWLLPNALVTQGIRSARVWGVQQTRLMQTAYHIQLCDDHYFVSRTHDDLSLTDVLVQAYDLLVARIVRFLTSDKSGRGNCKAPDTSTLPLDMQEVTAQSDPVSPLVSPPTQMAFADSGTSMQEGPHQGEWTSTNQEGTVVLSVPLRVAHDILNIPMLRSPADVRPALTRLLSIRDLDITMEVQTPSWQGTIDPGLLSVVQELTWNCQPLTAYASKVQYALAATQFQDPARHILLRPLITRIQTDTEYLQSRRGSAPRALSCCLTR
jgi:hypothetical protein